MSRVSLNRRLQALLESAEAIDPHAVKLHRLSPEARLQYDRWRRACDAEYARFDGDEPGAAYEALLEGSLHLPPPPRAVADALEMPEPITLHEDLTTGELAAIYTQMIGG